MLQMFFVLLDHDEDVTKFEALYHHYRKLLHFIAKGILKDDRLAEDAVQETFLRVAKNFSKIGEIKCHQTKNFLVIIVKRVSFTMLQMEHDESSIDDEDAAFAVGTQILREREKAEKHQVLVNLILSMPETYRQVLYLRYVFAYTPAETASLLGLSVDAVKKRSSRGRKLLQEKIEKELYAK